jgi:hypothetical protein
MSSYPIQDGDSASFETGRAIGRALADEQAQRAALLSELRETYTRLVRRFETRLFTAQQRHANSDILLELDCHINGLEALR